MQQGLGVFVDVIGKDSLSGPAAAAGASLLGIEKSAGSLGNVLAGVEKGIAGVAVAVTASVATIGAALTTLAVVGVKQAGELQQAVANISSIKPEINTQGVFSSLNLMQTRVAQSAKDMGAALYNLFSSIDATAEQGLALVEKFGRGAVASMTDAQTFGTAILGEMNAFKTGVEATDHLMDIFFNTVKVGVVTGQELAANLGLVAQNAKVAGVSVEELGGFIAGVTKEGGSAAQNINNLSNLFQKIVTKEAAAGFKELGVQVADATGKFRPIIDVLTDTRRVLTTYTESAAAAALQKIFPDLQARQGALVIMNELSTVRAATEENQQSTGAASDAYEKMVGTFENQTKLLRQSFDSVLTSVGAGLLPVLSSVTSSVQGFVKDTAPLFDAWQNRLQDAFKTGGFKPWLTEVGNVAGELGREIEKWIPPFTNWVGEAQKILGKTLTDVYDGTIVPWVTQRATDLKAKFETEWVPAVVDWWSSPETQGKLTGALDILGDTVKSWAGEGGYGNAAVKEAGVSLGTALVNSFQQQAVDAFGQLPDWMQDVLRGKLGVFPQVTPSGTGAAGGRPTGGIDLSGISPTNAPTSNGWSISSPNVVPNQFGPDQELTKAQADAACGPAAAVAFARIYGRNPTLREALMVAQDAGLWTTAGMKGPESQVALLGQLGVPSHTEQGVDWSKVQASIVGGTPVILDTPGHYFAVTGYNAESGQFNFGASGQAIRGGQPWMTPAQAEGLWTGNIRSSIYPNAAPTAAGAGATQFSAFDDLFRRHAGGLANDPNFIATVTAGAKAESRLNPNQITPDPTDAMPNAVSIGLFQEHDVHGLSRETRLDPEAAASRMVPKYADAYRQGQALGLTGAELASYTARYAEVPAGFRDPNGGASQRYTAAYNQVIGSGAATQDANGNYYAPNGTPLLTSTPPSPAYMAVIAEQQAAEASERRAALESSYQSAIAEQGGAAATPDEGRIGGGTFDPRILTQEKIDAAFGGADAEAAAGAKGKALIKAFDDAVEGEKPHALETLAGTVADLHQALLNDPQLSPEEAQARFGEVVGVISQALLDGTPEAQDAARKYLAGIEQGLAIDKIVEQTSTKANVAIQKAQEQIKTAYENRDKQIAALSTKKEEAIADRDAQQAETDRIAKAVEGAKAYVKAQEDELAAVHDLAKEERGFQEERAKADRMYQEKIAEFNTKKQQTATASTGFAIGMGGVQTQQHTDPQAAINQQIKDATAAHNVDVFNLNQDQAIKRANHAEDIKWKLEETALASTLKATILDPTAETARAASNAWKDAYDTTVVIPRQAATYITTTETEVDKINKGLGETLTGIRSEGDVAIERITFMTDHALPDAQTAAGTVMDPAIADTLIWQGHVRDTITLMNNQGSRDHPPESSSPSTDSPSLDNGPHQYAAGTSSSRSGLAWVGERGPELMRLPQGTQILSNAQSRSMMADSQPLVIHNYTMLDGQVIARNTRTVERQRALSGPSNGIGGL